MIRRIALLAPFVALAACSDLGVDLGGQDVAALEIENDDGATAVRVSPSGTVTGSLSVALNGDEELTIHLLDDGGREVNLGIAESIRVTVVNSVVARWDETGGNTGTLSGNQRGTTTLRVDVISAGAVDYSSPSIPVRVQ